MFLSRKFGASSCKLWPLFFQIMLTLSSSLPIHGGNGNETDRASLLAFKTQISHDPYGVLSSWNGSSNFCQWPGVTCGRRHQRIVELNLPSYQLQGSLSPHIGNLSFLRILHLGNNTLTNTIPQELGRLFRLQVLILTNNTFNGEIPVNISRCSNLISLGLAGNKLVGKLPAEFGSLSKLKVLLFYKNSLFGELPSSFGNLSYIEKLSGSYNGLGGNIPISLGRLNRLQFFSMGINYLSGTIPPSMFNISNLYHLSLPANQLQGSFPADLGLTLPNLEVFQMHTNQFGGKIPATISNAMNLSLLDLGKNQFTGKVPGVEGLHNLGFLAVDENHLGNGEDDDISFVYHLQNNTALEVFAISQNYLGGELPETVSNFSKKLWYMNFGTNQIRGKVPNEIGNLINLEVLSFSSNQMHGVIPTSTGKLQTLNTLNLRDNKLSGSIPPSLGNCTSLTRFTLSDNSFQGSIPPSLGSLQKLLFLSLSTNNLSGPIPKEVLRIPSLSMFLDLSENQLTGSLPMEVGKLVNLGQLIVSENKLSGEIPEGLGSCVSMESLRLEGNFFEGVIPESLKSLKAIDELNLSHNSLTGKIPEFLADFKLLKALDLSFNDFEGEVPLEGAFKNASRVSILGNKKLCGGISQFNLPQCKANSRKRQKLSKRMILMTEIVCACLGVILVASLLLFIWMRQKKSKTAPASSFDVSIPRVSYQDLLQATDGFSSSNLIGTGGFGSVYRGTLKPDETVVAVKVLNLQHREASKSFLSECQVLANTRHRNLLRVITACSSTDFQGNDFKVLVYDFMVNGSLDEWLHPAQNRGSLNLVLRLNIAIDVASALDYLHNHCEIPLVHCDLKPSNVLLDGDLTAHMGDFGLARFIQEPSPELSSSNQTSSISIRGTIGYAAPEYGMERKVSTYGDVYSFGILLLEMFTGKRPTDAMFKDGLNLRIYAETALLNGRMEIFDPILLGENASGAVAGPVPLKERIGTIADGGNRTGIYKILDSMVAVIKVGVACSAELPRDRMEISNAKSELHHIRRDLLRTRTVDNLTPCIVLP